MVKLNYKIFIFLKKKFFSFIKDSKKNFNANCSLSPCNENKGLICINDLCECSSHQYFDGTICSEFFYNAYGQTFK